MVIRLLFNLWLLAFVVTAVAVCGRKTNTPSSNVGTSTARDNYLSLMPQLDQWALRCNGDVAKLSYSNECDDGDNLAFNGMLCAAGSQFGCDNAKAAFDGQRFWRSKRRVGMPEQGMPNFSRDMVLGAMLYLVSTKDAQTTDSYMNWIRSNGSICLDRCVHTPITQNLMEHVNYAVHGKTMPFWKEPIDLVLDKALVLQAQTVPPNYQLELIAEELWIRRIAGTWTKDLDSVAAVLIEREPFNPFYLYIAEGVSQRMIELAWQQVPKKEPEFKREWAFASTFEPGYSGEYAKADPNISMVWEWIMLGHLIERGY